MSWSIMLVRVAGSEIRIHLTFLLLLLWIGIAEYLSGGAAAALDSVSFVVAVFACVVLHELGHALTARRYGITTPDITLLPIGGLARLSRLPEKPSEEIAIALAGPAVNVAIALVLILFFGAVPDLDMLKAIENPEPGFAARLAFVNLFLVLFNLIPAFPMDGGRVLRAVLALRVGRRRATEIAAQIGQAVAFGFGFLGLMSGNAILVFIAVFVYLAASAEAGETSLMELARRLPVERAMVSAFEALGPDTPLGEAAAALIRTTQHEFPVVDDAGRPKGFLTRETMMLAMKQAGPDVPVRAAAVAVPEIGPRERLSRALALMQEKRTAIVAVTDLDGRLLGYVSQDNLAELMMLDAAGLAARPTRA